MTRMKAWREANPEKYAAQKQLYSVLRRAKTEVIKPKGIVSTVSTTVSTRKPVDTKDSFVEYGEA